MNVVVTEETFKIVAKQYYDNPQCFQYAEFEQDLKRFNYVAHLLLKYNKTSVLNERLILNHIIILHNLFGVFTAAGLFCKTDRSGWIYLRTFLEFLSIIPQDSPQYTLPIDQSLLQKLNNL